MRRLALLALLGCSAPADGPPPRVLYRLSSNDVGYPWHLHAKDGALLCELPCDEWIAQGSGSYLVVHDDDPKKMWRADIPSAEPGNMVVAQPHIGKGSIVRYDVGVIVGTIGALATLVGVTVLTYGLVNTDYGLVAAGGVIAAVGLVPTSAGFFLIESNRPTSVQIRIMPTGLIGMF